MDLVQQIKITGDASAILLDHKKQVYEAAMVATRYNQSKACKVLGVSRSTLRKNLKDFFGDLYV